jgi:hypothetical protein
MKTVILLGTAHRVQGAERGICNIEAPITKHSLTNFG